MPKMNEDYCDCGIPLLNGNSCDKCNKEINPRRMPYLLKNPEIAFTSKPEIDANGELEKGSRSADPYLTFRSGNAKSKAIKSARLVDGYGTYIQIVGIIIGAIYLGIFWWFGTRFEEYRAYFFFYGILTFALIAIIAMIAGALYRMFSNYIIARLESD